MGSGDLHVLWLEEPVFEKCVDYNSKCVNTEVQKEKHEMLNLD